jgi:hypothetical protein
MTSLAEALSAFAPPPPELLARRELLRRIDSKFALSASRVADVVGGLAGDYAALPLPGGGFLATYQSLYFDTPDLQCFHDHRRGRRLRHKVRIRHYPDRQVSYLEVKSRVSDLVTDKRRLALPFGTETLGPREHAFLRQRVGTAADALAPLLWIDYSRISLIGLHTHERVTIDVDLGFRTLAGGPESLAGLAIVEVKQSPFCARTPIMLALADSGLREGSLSKYCVAVTAVTPQIRRNRLLPDLRAIERIVHDHH